MVLCFGMSFFCYKIIPTKRDILKLANDKHIKMTILGSMFFALGLLIVLIQIVLRFVF